MWSSGVTFRVTMSVACIADHCVRVARRLRRIRHFYFNGKRSGLDRVCMYYIYLSIYIHAVEDSKHVQEWRESGNFELLETGGRENIK